MRTRPLLIIVLIGSFILLGIGAALPTAKAQGCTLTTYDLSSAVITYGSYNATDNRLEGAFVDSSVTGLGYGQVWLDVDFPMGASGQLYQVQFDLKRVHTSPSGGYPFYYFTLGTWSAYWTVSSGAEFDWQTHTLTATSATGDTPHLHLVMPPDVTLSAVRNLQFCFTAAGATPTPTPSPTPTGTITPTATPAFTPVPAGACAATWSVTSDFRQGPGGWLPRNANTGNEEAVIIDSGYEAVAGLTDGGYSRRVVIERTFKQSSVITGITANITYEPGTDGTGGKQLLGLDITSGSFTLFNGGNPPAAGNQTYSWVGTRTVTKLQINAWASGVVASPMQADGNAIINTVTITGTGFNPDGICNSSAPGSTESWAYPVAQNEQAATDPIRSLKQDLIIAGLSVPYLYLGTGIPGGASYDNAKIATMVLSSNSDTYVHSMTDGTVESVTPLTDPCSLSWLQYATKAPAYTCQFNPDFTAVWGISYHAVSIVTIATTNAKLSYAVLNTNVQVGQSVSKGCILGSTLPFYIFRLGTTVDPTGVFELWPDGYTVVQGRDLSGIPFDVVPYMQEVPQDIRCNATGAGGGAGAGCTLVKNSSFAPANDGNWTSLTSAAPSNPAGADHGLLLNTGVYQFPAGLDATTQYGITVSYHLVAGETGSFTLTLGSHDPYTVAVTSQAEESSDFAADNYLPLTDAGFILKIEPGDSSANVVIDYVCVFDSNEGNIPLPSPCIFKNPNFDAADGWTLSGTAAIDNGLATLGNGDSISQAVMLSPKAAAAQGYKLIVQARRKGVAATGDSINLDWTEAHSGGGTGATWGPFDNQLVWVTVEDTISVSTKLSYTITLTAATTGSSGQKLQIDKVCIETDDGVNPPGYFMRPLITAECKVCTYAPVGDPAVDIPELVQWLECAIAQIWHCQAKQILVGIWTVVSQILMFLGMLRLWLAATIGSFVAWINADIQVIMRYFSAMFRNLQTALQNAISYGPSSVTYVTQSGGSNFWDFLLSIVNGITGALNNFKEIMMSLLDKVYSLLMAVLGFVQTIITLILSLVGSGVTTLISMASNIITALISGFNGGAVTLGDGALTCNEPGSMLYYPCLGFYVLDNTIFSGPVGYMVPLIIGAVSIDLLMWGLNRIKAIFA